MRATTLPETVFLVMLKMLAIRVGVRLVYWPSRWVHGLMCAIGVWRQADWADDGVLFGAVPSRRDLRRYHDLGIRAVVNLCEEFAGHRRTMASLGMEQLHLPTLDYHCPSEAHLREGVAFIQDRIGRGEKVYVHCKAGRGRSAILVLCYLMASRRITADEADVAVRRARKRLAHGLARHPAVRNLERSFLDDKGLPR